MSVYLINKEKPDDYFFVALSVSSRAYHSYVRRTRCHGLFRAKCTFNSVCAYIFNISVSGETSCSVKAQNRTKTIAINQRKA
jgi:hypothetical protein